MHAVKSSAARCIFVCAVATISLPGCQHRCSKPVSSGVVSVTLVNAETGQAIVGMDPLMDGTTVRLSSLPTRNLSIRANVDPPDIDSVQFDFEDHNASSLVGGPPFSLPPSVRGKYVAEPLEPGPYHFSVTPYCGGGKAGNPFRIKFDVVDE